MKQVIGSSPFTCLRQAPFPGFEHTSGGFRTPLGVGDLLPVMARAGGLYTEKPTEFSGGGGDFDAAVAIADEAQRLATLAAGNHVLAIPLDHSGTGLSTGTTRLSRSPLRDVGAHGILSAMPDV